MGKSGWVTIARTGFIKKGTHDKVIQRIHKIYAEKDSKSVKTVEILPFI